MKMVRPRGCALGSAKAECPQRAKLFRSARNHTLNYLIRQARLRKHEIILPEAVGSDGHAISRDAVDECPSPEHQLLQGEFWARVLGALAELTPRQRELIRRRYIGNESIFEMAAAFHLNEKTAGEALRRAP